MKGFQKILDKRVCFILQLFIFQIGTDLYSQSGQNLNFSIEFIKSISKQSDVFEKNILDAISDFVFGSGELTLVKPVNMFAYDSNKVWILDQGFKGIIEINKNEKKFDQLDIEKTFPSIVGICQINENELLFTDSYYNDVFHYNLKEEMLSIFCDYKINKPTGIAFNNSKNEIWIIQTGKHNILIINKKEKILKTIGSRGKEKGEFNFPTSIWIDKKGKAYVVDAMNFRVQIFDSEGEFISMFGEQGDASGFFARPKGIATDSYGNIYVVDGLFHNVQIFDKDGNFLNYFGSQGKSEKEFWLPQGIFIDQNDRIYIADSYNSRIQIFQLRAK